MFISKTDGKLPLFSWLVAVLISFMDDPLFAGRLISILSGIVTLAGVILIAQKLYSREVGWCAGIFYIICPYALHLERMAMLESLLTCLGVGSVYISLKIANTRNIKVAWFLGLGALMGLAFSTKATALLLFPVLIYIFYERSKWRQADFRIAFAGSLITALSLIIPFLLSSQAPVFAGRHAVFSAPEYYIPWRTLLTFPWQIWLRNLMVIGEFYSAYLTLPVLLLLILSIINIWKEKAGRRGILICWAVLPVASVLLIANSFFSRYFLLAIPPVIILAATGFKDLLNYICQKFFLYTAGKFEHIRIKPFIGAVLLLIILLNSIIFSFQLLKNPVNAPFPKLDRMLYVEGMPSGFGLKMAAEFLIAESNKSPLILMTTFGLGNPQEGLAVFLWGEKNIRVIPANWWPQSPKLIPENDTFPLLASKHQRTPLRQEPVSTLKNAYFLYPFTTYPVAKFLKANPGWEKIWQHKHLNGKDTINIFKKDG